MMSEHLSTESWVLPTRSLSCIVLQLYSVFIVSIKWFVAVILLRCGVLFSCVSAPERRLDCRPSLWEALHLHVGSPHIVVRETHLPLVQALPKQEAVQSCKAGGASAGLKHMLKLGKIQMFKGEFMEEWTLAWRVKGFWMSRQNHQELFEKKAEELPSGWSSQPASSLLQARGKGPQPPSSLIATLENRHQWLLLVWL